MIDATCLNVPFNTYRKTALTLAFQMEEPFSVITPAGRVVADAGDYLCQGPAGERWPVKRKIFEATYVPAFQEERIRGQTQP